MDQKGAGRSWLRERWFVWVPLSFLALLAVAYAAYRAVLKHRLNARLQAIREEGYPATLEELDAWYEEPPPGQNAADIYMKAFRLIVEPTEEEAEKLPLVGYAELPPPGEALPQEMMSAIEKHLEPNKQAIRLLHEAASLGRSRYPIDLRDGAAMRVNHLTSVRRGAELLALAACWHAREGNPEAARALTSCFALGESLGDEPVLISQLVRYAIDAISVYALQDILSLVSLPAGALTALESAIRSLPSKPGTPPRWVLGEMLFVAEASKPEQLGSELRLSGWTAPAYRQTGVLQLDALYRLAVMDEFVEACREPFPRRIEASRRVASEKDRRASQRPWLHPLTVRRMPTVYGGVLEEAADFARLRSARVALAVERFRLDNERLPEKLSELVPAYIEEVPADPFDGKPVRYKRLKTGYVLYSLGRDQDDDSGEEGEYDADSDIVFRVTR